MKTKRTLEEIRGYFTRAKGHTKYWNKFVKEYIKNGNKPFTTEEIITLSRKHQLRYSEWLVNKLIQQGVIMPKSNTGLYQFNTKREIHYLYLYEAIFTFANSEEEYRNLPDHLKYYSKN